MAQEPEIVQVKILDADGDIIYEEDGETPVTMDITREQYNQIQQIAKFEGIPFQEALQNVIARFLQLEQEQFQSAAEPVDVEDEDE